MRGALVTIIVGSLGMIGVGCSPPPNCTGTGTVTHLNLRYAHSPGTAANMQSLDLYLPVRPAGCAPAPLVAYVHGGGFVHGDKGRCRSLAIERRANPVAKKEDTAVPLNPRQTVERGH